MSCAIVLGSSPTKKWVGEFCIANPEVLKVIQNNKVMSVSYTQLTLPTTERV